MAKAKHGALEKDILAVLWGRGHSTVREVLDHLAGEHAYTTVMTVLDRLHKKGVLSRQKDGQAWRYHPVASREETLGEKMAELLAEADKPEPLLMSFLDRAEEIDPELLDQLEGLIQRYRRRRDH